MPNYPVALALDLAARAGVGAIRASRWVRAAAKGDLDRHRAALAGDAAARVRLGALVGLAPSDFPMTDGWAGTFPFLEFLAETVAARQPATVVEYGSGVSTLVIAAALKRLGGSRRFVSYDHHAGFAEQTRRRLAELGLSADVRAVPLTDSAAQGYPGKFYASADLPGEIDLLVIDGPPAWLTAGTRGAAAPVAFPMLAAGGLVVLDDADRDGERENARRWATDWPGIDWRFDARGKGLLVGTRK